MKSRSSRSYARARRLNEAAGPEATTVRPVTKAREISGVGKKSRFATGGRGAIDAIRSWVGAWAGRCDSALGWRCDVVIPAKDANRGCQKRQHHLAVCGMVTT